MRKTEYGEKERFREKLYKVYRDGKKMGYRAIGMLDILAEEDYIKKIDEVVNQKGMSYGFERAYKLDTAIKGELTIEYVVSEEGGDLFSDDVKKKCRDKLEKAEIKLIAKR